MARIDIVRNGNKVEFVPSVLKASPGDTVFWRNLDPDEQHWITLKGKDNTFWFAAPLAPAVAGAPPDVTGTISLPNPPVTLVYVCSLHGTEEGTIDTHPQAEV